MVIEEINYGVDFMGPDRHQKQYYLLQSNREGALNGSSEALIQPIANQNGRVQSMKSEV